MFSYTFDDYSNEPIELVARRFQEIERHEREMARIRELERIQNESRYGGFRSFEDDNTQSYRSSNYHTNDKYFGTTPIRNNLFYGNDNYALNYHQQQYPVKRNWIEDDEEEDELYFYGGGGRKKKNNSPVKEEIYKEPIAKTDEIEFDPAVFESSSDWSSEFESETENIKNKKKKKPTKSTTVSTSSKPKSSNESTSFVKPKAYAPKVVDLDAPTVIKLPPNPIPNTWAHIVHNPLKAIQKQLPSSVEILTKSIVGKTWFEGLKLRNPVQGILMRPPFDEETFTIKQWAKFMQKILPKVMDDGYLFIWIEREELADVIRAAEKYLSFKYVENLCWIRRDVGNRLMREVPKESALFYKSKMTLLILRRDPNSRCKLRHQRNPDCIFDFVGPGRMPDGRVYDVIETLLDGTKLPGPHLMHLWAGNSPTDRLVYQARKHWIRVLETDEEQVEEESEVIASVKFEISEDIKDEENQDVEEEIKVPDEAEIEKSMADEIEVDKENSTDSTDSTHSTHSTTVDELETLLSNTDVSEPDVKSKVLSSGTNNFDENFLNFIICEPVSNC
jgi:hypothetical protein